MLRNPAVPSAHHSIEEGLKTPCHMKIRILGSLAILFVCNCTQAVLAELVVFGSGSNKFGVEMVRIGHTANRADSQGNPNPVGAVRYNYFIGKHEISRDMVTKANASAGLGITLDAMPSVPDGTNPNRPATGVSWKEAAVFVNYLNQSQGYQPAYNIDSNGNLQLWSNSQAWRPLGQNDFENGIRVDLFRHQDAAFWLPSVDEWYKAAYYDPNKGSEGGYWKYATGSDSVPTPVKEGTLSGTAVHSFDQGVGPAFIDNAGGLSPLGTMAQNGNVWEWMETSADLESDFALENRISRGGSWLYDAAGLASSERYSETTSYEAGNAGFRIAGSLSAVPEPSSLMLLCAACGAFGGIRMKRFRLNSQIPSK